MHGIFLEAKGAPLISAAFAARKEHINFKMFINTEANTW